MPRKIGYFIFTFCFVVSACFSRLGTSLAGTKAFLDPEAEKIVSQAEARQFLDQLMAVRVQDCHGFDKTFVRARPEVMRFGTFWNLGSAVDVEFDYGTTQ